MNIIFFTHPTFLKSQSMPRFAKMLGDGMLTRGHYIEYFTAKPIFYKLPFMKKWMGYIDQYLLFRFFINRKLKAYSKDTLFVFTDHALGPWIPFVASKPHVIHCHDFMAQESATGAIAENPTGWSGRIYQNYIRRGYSEGRNFIAVSEKTKIDLQKFLSKTGVRIEMVYNGLSPSFRPGNAIAIRQEISMAIGAEIPSGYLLHVGGNQWYKNRKGVIEIYNAWRNISNIQLPLFLVGPKANSNLQASCDSSPYRSDIYLLSGKDDEFVRKAYAGASVFIFPSLAEGFGWPIAEAMASGCPVITTNQAPMTEVSGEAGFLISRMPNESNLRNSWAYESAQKVEAVLSLPDQKRKEIVVKGLENAKRFDSEKALNLIEGIYKEVMLNKKIV